jgi:ribosome-associated toxin RatA of RatAB toxin-antitoxin module
MRSTISVDIAAPPRLVFELARDVERWPELLPHYLAVRAEDREAQPGGALTARMTATRQVVPMLGYGIPVAWRARTWAEEDALRLRFVHRGGATNGMDVTWRIEEAPGGCHVSIDHDFDPPLPGWSALVTGLFVRPIATRTLATFKAIAEAAHAATPTVAPTASVSPPGTASRSTRSARARTTKTST